MRRLPITLLAALAVTAWSIPSFAATLDIRVVLGDGQTPVSGAVVLAGDTPADPITAEIAQKDRAFHPHVLIIPVGSSVDFPNRDNTQHHVYSFSPAKTFNIALYADRPEAPIVFDKPGIVEIGCNIHDHMQAFVVVADSAVFGRTDEHGMLSLESPAITDSDTVTLQVWHPRLIDNTQPLTVGAEPGKIATITLELLPAPIEEHPLDQLQQRFRDL